MLMTGQHGNQLLLGLDILGSGLGHRSAQIAQDGAGGAELGGDALDAGQNKLGPFGRCFPGA